MYKLTKYKDTYRLKGWKYIYHANTNPKKAVVTILVSDKVDFRTMGITRDKEGHCKILKGSIHENLNDPRCVHLKVSKYMNQNLTELKGETAYLWLKLWILMLLSLHWIEKVQFFKVCIDTEIWPTLSM